MSSYIDFVTVIVSLLAIALPLRYSIVLILVAALYQETASALPAGIYFCCFLSYGIVLGLLRNSLSWRALAPWIISVNGLFVYIALIKILLYMSLRQTQFAELFWPLMGRTLLSCVVASLLCVLAFNQQRWMLRRTLHHG